jgi:ketosteroid isomerase-like protein
MRQVSLAEVPEEIGTEFAARDAKAPPTDEERVNAEVLQRMLHAIAAGRFGELRELLAPDVTFEMAVPPRFPWIRRAEGAEAVIEAIAHNFSTVCHQMPHPLAMVSRDDTVMIMARESGRLAETGEAYEVLLAHQYTFRDGRLAHFRSVSAENEPA